MSVIIKKFLKFIKIKLANFYFRTENDLEKFDLLVDRLMNRRIIVFGAGAEGKRISAILAENTLFSYCFIDNNISTETENMWGGGCGYL